MSAGTNLSPEGDADLLHLLRAHIVGADDEALGVPGGYRMRYPGDGGLQLTHQGGW